MAGGENTEDRGDVGGAGARGGANRDWAAGSGGAAKWAAVVVLGGASVMGVFWSVFGRAPNPALREPHGGAAGWAAVIESEGGDRSEMAQPRDPLAAVPLVANRTIDVNAATVEELQLLPGIGPAMAERIVADREEGGAFESVEDLMRVSGIGPRTIENIRPFLRAFEGEGGKGETAVERDRETGSETGG